MSSRSNNSTRFDYTIKIILLGDQNVGKSTLLTNLAYQHGITDCQCMDYRPNGHVELDVWRNGKRILARVVDTGGQERFRSITASFYRGAQGCLLIFDAEKKNTFEHVHNWHTDLEMYTSKQPMSTFLVGINTQSHGRQVTPDQAERQATQLGMQFHELNLLKKCNAVDIVLAMLDRIIIHVSRLPSVTVDIIPHQLHQLHQHLSDEGRKKAEAREKTPKKFHCAC